MLTYHPALDAYHAAFRTLLLVRFDIGREFPEDTLRILDFYLTFPALIEDITLPQNLRRWKRRFSSQKNPYHYPAIPSAVFAQITPIHEHAVRTLAARELLDPEAAKAGTLVSTDRSLPDQLSARLRSRTEESSELLGFLTGDLASIPLYGPRGLKDRTKLLEYRYDPR